MSFFIIALWLLVLVLCFVATWALDRLDGVEEELNIVVERVNALEPLLPMAMVMARERERERRQPIDDDPPLFT